MVSQQINSVESLQQLLPAPEAMKPKQPLQRKMHVRSRLPSKPTIIRGITYYKAKFTESENDLEERELCLQPWLASWNWRSGPLSNGVGKVCSQSASSPLSSLAVQAAYKIVPFQNVTLWENSHKWMCEGEARVLGSMDQLGSASPGRSF